MSQSPSSPPPPSRPMNPLHGTTIDTAPDSLGLPKVSNVEAGEATDEAQLSRSPSGSFVKRTMEKLSRSTTRPRSSREEHNTSGPRKIFSISRRSKDNQSSDDKGGEFHVSQQSATTDAGPLSAASHASDDSPFIRPASPVEDAAAQPSRPSILNFRGTGSMRAGTQTLIQALQAMPWTEEAENEDNSSEDSQGDTDEEGPALASSIHALYKPVAHARRGEMSPSEEHPIALPEYFGDNELGGGIRSPDELVEDDFEASSPRMTAEEDLAERPGTSPPVMRRDGKPAVRSGSMATVKLQRRARLASKLREVFEVEDIGEVVAGQHGAPFNLPVP
ncbi:hypothetical protein M422DRAFT_251011 [Sphaerobolus stellatus SS14]|uniref:Uncharacterized protein n=1 Tax=Sphaerobolus stellatus (strain SS14) TaxID=990650 RepID=A0A0C9US67_SPHS4|nr:hypothetical protein M422DRAFT_251011 [Sphaerobolus stellatus SS14]